MKDNYKDLFRKLGYEVENKGALLYGALIEDVIDMMEDDKTEEEIRDIFPSICLELYRFCYETTRNRFFNYIDNFRKSINKKQRKEMRQLLEMGLETDGFGLELEDSVIYFAKYFIREKKKGENNNNKILIKGDSKV